MDLDRAALIRHLKEVEEKRKTTLELDRRAAKTDYMRYLMLTHGYRYKFDEYKHTKIIADTLEKVNTGEIKKLMIFSPPQHLKSTSATQSFPSYYLGNHRNEDAIIVSYNEDLAVKFGAANRSKIAQFGEDIFGVKLKHGSGSKTQWSLDKYGGSVRSVGILGGITGNTGDLIFIDDPIAKRQDAESPAKRSAIIAEYEDSIQTRLNPESKIVLIQTRWHENDLAGYILEQEGEDWTVLYLPAEAAEDDEEYYTKKYGCKTITLPRKPGQLLWEKQGDYGFTHEFFKKRKKISRTWNSLYRNRPTADEGGQFKRKYFQYFTEKDDYYTLIYDDETTKRVLKSECSVKFTTVDTALKEKQQNDPTSMSFFIQTPDNDLLFRDNFTERLEVPKQYGQIRTYQNRWNPNYVAVEDKQSGTGLIQQARNDGKPFRILTADQSKTVRATQIMIMYENKKVFHYKHMPNLSECEEQLLSFPNGKHDDIVDTLSYAGILVGEEDWWCV